MELDEVLGRFEGLGDEARAEGMKRFGIRSSRVYGVPMPGLISLSREIGKDHMLAGALWDEGSREGRILAACVDDPALVTDEQMERWVADFDNWETCDQVIMKLFERTDSAPEISFRWGRREEEFVKRAGFVLMARFPRIMKEWDDEMFLPILDEIERGAGDERHNVKKGVNWALREVGKRSLYLNGEAIKRAEAILKLDTKGARWIARDALRELGSDKVQSRLRGMDL